MENFGEKLRIARLSRKLSQENIADDLKMTQQEYSKIERGERDPKLSKLERIAQVLGLKLEDIVSTEDSLVFNVHNNPNSNNGLVINESRTSLREEKQLIELLKEEVKLLHDKYSLMMKMKELEI